MTTNCGVWGVVVVVVVVVVEVVVLVVVVIEVVVVVVVEEEEVVLVVLVLVVVVVLGCRECSRRGLLGCQVTTGSWLSVLGFWERIHKTGFLLLVLVRGRLWSAPTSCSLG